jgi:hypothetical protein
MTDTTPADLVPVIHRALVHDMKRGHELAGVQLDGDTITVVDHHGWAHAVTLEPLADLTGYRADMQEQRAEADADRTTRDEATRAELGAAARAANEPDPKPAKGKKAKGKAKDETPADNEETATDG